MKKITLLLATLSLLLAVIPLTAKAFEARKGNAVTVSKDQTIDGNFYTAGANINIEGHIKGDLFCAGQNISIKGTVDGSVFCAGQNINLDGAVAGSARLAASTININGSVGQNLDSVGSAINLSDQAKVGWDMLFGAAGVNINGQIGRDLDGAGANINLNGPAGGNVKILLGDKKSNNSPSSLTLGDKAQIGGRLEYWGKQDAVISGLAKVAGGVEKKTYQPRQNATSAARFGGIILPLFSSLVIGLILISIFRKQITGLTDLMFSWIGASIGIGFLALLLAPFIFVILMITLIGIPLSLILLALWLIALYISKTITGIFIGRLLIEKYWAAKKESLIWPMIIGVLIVNLVCYIPIVGWLFCLIAVLWALGAMILSLKKSSIAGK